MLVAVSLAQFGGTLLNPLIWDSVPLVQNDADLRDLGSIPSFFVEPANPQGDLKNEAVHSLQYYRPVTRTAYALTIAVFRGDPVGHRIVQLLVNAAVVVCFFLLLAALHGRQMLAFWAALLFAVNPARGEAVCWVYGLSDLLAAGFCLPGFPPLLPAPRRGRCRRIRPGVAVTGERIVAASCVAGLRVPAHDR